MPNKIRSPCSAMMSSSCKLTEDETENRAPERNSGVHDAILGKKCITPASEETCSISSRGNCSAQKHSSPISVKKVQRMFEKAIEDNIQSTKAYVTELKEELAKIHYQKQLLVCQVLELEKANEALRNDRDTLVGQSPIPWNVVFEDPLDMLHVKESAEVVAKIVGFCESGLSILREMFGLNFVPLSDKKTWMGWNLISNLLTCESTLRDDDS